jgi:Uncharacterized protein conserved in bacteria
MLFALIAEDTADPQKRLEARADHLKHLESLGDRLVFGGPFLDEKGGMVGSLMVIEADDQQQAEAFYAQDPFMQRGVFASYTIRPWRMGFNNAAGR